MRLAESARRLVERGVEASQCRLGQQEDVRVGRERQCEQRSPVALHIRELLDAERIGEDAARAEEPE